ncbi:MAG: C69 family dipeptidase [Acidobacteriota bacterium]
MCDIALALPDATRNGTVIFAKNSDRPAGESQVLSPSPAREPKSGTIDCSYVRIADARSLATVGTRPYWSWGYETGVNEAGVIGGNTAVFTRPLHDPENRRQLGLTGLELLRLALERSESAEQAVRIVADLLEEHGQWGSAVRGASHEEGSYDNAFLLADRKEGWILETAGRDWAAQRIPTGTRSLSNQLTIRNPVTLSSDRCLDTARRRGWWRGADEDFDFALAFSDHEHFARQVSQPRWRRTTTLLEEAAPAVDARTMIRLLRDHYEDTFLGGPLFSPFLPDFQTVCMHDSPAGFTWGDTATSLVIELDPNVLEPPVCWFAYLPPCCGVFLPFVPFRDRLPESVCRVGSAGLQVRSPVRVEPDRPAESSLWWKFHRLVKSMARESSRRAVVREAFDAIEDRLLLAVERGAEAPGDLLADALAEVEGVLSEFTRRWDVDSGNPVS